MMGIFNYRFFIPGEIVCECPGTRNQYIPEGIMHCHLTFVPGWLYLLKRNHGRFMQFSNTFHITQSIINHQISI